MLVVLNLKAADEALTGTLTRGGQSSAITEDKVPRNTLTLRRSLGIRPRRLLAKSVESSSKCGWIDRGRKAPWSSGRQGMSTSDNDCSGAADKGQLTLLLAAGNGGGPGRSSNANRRTAGTAPGDPDGISPQAGAETGTGGLISQASLPPGDALEKIDAILVALRGSRPA
jgi:hypothetical protein